jgi:SAM-dependent methyltransferase
MINATPSDQSEVERQHQYHSEMFGALYAWNDTHERIIDLSGDATQQGLLGLDQMGHFGPHGCDLVVERIVELGEDRLRICEIGSGFGGAFRHIVSGLTARGVDVPVAVGVELVAQHCALGNDIARSLGFPHSIVCADASQIPLTSESADLVMCTGSVPHFSDIVSVFREAARVLRPGGHLVFTEEVSLADDPSVELPAEFRDSHPEGVFFITGVDERIRQLRAAGFTDIRHDRLTSWAIDLLDARLKALRLFLGTTTQIYGRVQTERIVSLLRITLAVYRAGLLVPSIVSARRPT